MASRVDDESGEAKAVWNSSNEASSGSWVSISTPSLFIITLRACAQPRISAGAKCAPILGLQISRATKFSTHIVQILVSYLLQISCVPWMIENCFLLVSI